MQWAVETGIYDRKDKRFLTIKMEPFRAIQCPCYFVVVAEASDELVLKTLGRDPRASA